MLLAAAAPSACAVPADELPPATSVVDSSGLVAVHHPDRVMAEAPVLGLVEEVRIGTVEGREETQFHDVGSATQAPTGEIVVLDRGSLDVRVFSADGAFLRRFGREGDGPGEFRSPRLVRVHGDTVVVHDERPHLYRLDGTFLDDGVPVPRGEGRPFRGSIRRVGAGWVLRVEDCVGCLQIVDGATVRESVSLRAYDPFEGTVGATLLAFEKPEATLLVEGGVGLPLHPFFQAVPSTARGAGGIAHHAGSEYRIDLYDGEGVVRRRITAEVPSRPVTTALMDDLLARIRDGGGGRMSRDRERKAHLRRADLLGHATSVPVLGSISMSSAGWLMVERRDLGDPVRHEVWLDEPEPTHWDVFDSDGALVGRLAVPPLVAPLQLIEGGLIGLTRDDLHVEYVVRYRFERASPP